MPFDGITEIAQFSAQAASGLIITPQGRQPVLGPLPSRLVGTPTGKALIDFTKDCFGISDPQKVVGQSYIKEWARALFVPEDAAAVEAEVARILANTSGIRQKNQKLTDQLAQAAEQLTDWNCETVGQMGDVAALAERMARTLGQVSNVDDSVRAKWVNEIGNIARKNGDSPNAIYATARRIDQLWAQDEQLVQDVYQGLTNLNNAEEPLDPSAKAIAEIARYAAQASSGFILSPVGGAAVLGPLPSNLENLPTGKALKKFTEECFGITDPQKVIDQSYIKEWAKALGVPEGAEHVQAKVADVLTNTPGIDGSKTLRDQLAQAVQQMRDWNCASLEETGEVAAVAERMARTLDGVTHVDEKRLNAFVANISVLAVTNGASRNDIFDTAMLIDRLWAKDAKFVEKLDQQKTTLAEAEQSLWPDQVLTEIAECAWQISENEDPKVEGRGVLIDPRQFSAAVNKMVRAFGKEFFGSETINGKIVDPAAIRDWADRCPEYEIGSSSDPADRGDALRQYVKQRTQQIHANHLADLNLRLTTQYKIMRDRNCDTTVEASDVYDYAIQLADRAVASKSAKPFKNPDEKAKFGLKQIATTMEGNALGGKSQFDFMNRMKQLEKTDEAAADSVWDRKNTIGEAEKEIGSPGKDKHPEDPEKGAPEKERAVAL